MVRGNRGGKQGGQRHAKAGKRNFEKERPKFKKGPRKEGKFNKGRGKPGKKFGKKRFAKKDVSEDQLDRELENYWGNEAGSKHLDQEMDDYWSKKPSKTD